MEINMLGAASEALLIILDPYRLMMLSGGVLMGLVLGIIPGIGGLVGLSLLLPFTFAMDSYTAFAVLLGMSAVTSTSDTIPAVLFGVPGSTSAQATVMDGYPMAKKGEAGRALGAAYTASLIGGLFGAALLGFSIPLLRPLVLHIGSPELLAFAIFGISMVAVLAGNTPLRGLGVAGFGIMLAMIGSDMNTGTQRWTMGALYLWGGLPLVPMLLGLFALPEIAELAIKRKAVTQSAKYDVSRGMLQGAKDTLQNWWLVLRSGLLGAGIGVIPGLGNSVVDWFAYGHALQTVKGAHKTFGQGDVRGVIGVESATNSINAGSLVPTVAFGVPGSAGMAILLGAFLIHGLVPGPEMLASNLNITYSMVWSIAIANILGAGICFLFSGYLAKIALVRYTLLLPLILTVCYVGAFQASRDWGDLYTLLIFAVIGWGMKQLKWPRPPLILGFVLGAIIERYMFVSIGRFGIDWLTRPVVAVLLTLAALTILVPFWRDIRRQGGLGAILTNFGKPRLSWELLMYVFFIGVIGTMLWQALGWRFEARIGPVIVGTFSLGVLGISLVFQFFKSAPATADGSPQGAVKSERLHMDIVSDFSELPLRTVLIRGALFFGWLIAFMISMATIGLIPTVPLFVIAFMRIEGREPWTLTLSLTAGLTAFVYLVFDRLLSIPWPSTFLGTWVPALQVIPSV